MSQESCDALNRLVAAFEHHHDVAQAGERISEAAILEAENRLRDAFFTYDDLLFTEYGVELPFDIVELENDDEYDDDLETRDDYSDSYDDEADIVEID